MNRAVVEAKLDALGRCLSRIERKRPATLETMHAVFDRLETLGAIGAPVAERLRLATGFRNLAIHRYDDIDWSIVFDACRDGLEDLRTFAREIEAHTRSDEG